MKAWLVFFFLCFSFTLPAQPTKPPGPVKGLIDLRSYDFQREVLQLEDPWEFYWNKLIAPGDFDTTLTHSWMDMREGWTQSTAHEALGVATYRVHILLPEQQRGFSLFFPAINCAGRIWVNGNLVGESGTVSRDPEKYVAKLTSTIVALPEREDTLDVVIQVANFSQGNGGLWNYPQIGRTQNLVMRMNRSNGIENFFAGCLIAMCLYQLILYFLYRRGKPFLWLSLICLAVAIRAMVIHGGSFLLPNLFSDVSWSVWKKLEYGAVYSIVAFFPLYVRDLFADHAPRRPLQVFVVTGSLLCALVLFTPQNIFRQVLEIVHVAYLLGFVYAFYTIARAWRSGNKDARIILFGILACFPFILMEIMKNSVFIGLNIPSMYYVEVGVLIFLLFQVYLLANHQAQSHKALEALNVGLEGMVGERTRELVAANDVRDKLLSVISHDVRSPLNSLQGMLDLYNNGQVTQEEFSHFSRQIQSDLGNTGLLVDNILVWTSRQLKGAKPHREKFTLNSIVGQNVKLFESAAAAKQLTLSQHLKDGINITWDKDIVHLALRNLLANAIKFSHEGGGIEISAESIGKEIHLRVRDHGVGIDEKTMETLLSSKRSSSLEGTGREKGIGIGLSLCREYLIHAGGTLMAESVHGKGSTFTIVIPQ